jgi:hypothetical protein
MPKRTNRFQRLVTLLNASLGDNARVVESAMLSDKITGDLREVDIVIQTMASNYEVTIAIEVVGRSRKADSTWVESMHTKHLSLPTDKLVLVAEKGFYGPALKKAAFYGIEAISIESAMDTDWKLATELTASGFFNLITFRYNAYFVYTLPDGQREQIQVSVGTRIVQESNEFTLNEFIRFVLDSQVAKDALFPRIMSTDERYFWFSYTKPGILWTMDVDDETVPVIELRVGLEVEYVETPVEYATGHYRGTPFIEGVSSDNRSKLHFVMLRKPDGRCEGLFVDAAGIRKLTESKYQPVESN